MSDLFYLLTAVAIGGVLVWFALRMEPHWVSRDGRRFICRGQIMDRHGNVHGGWHEYRVQIIDDEQGARGLTDATRPRIDAARRSMMRRRQRDQWTVAARSPNPPRRKAVFLLHQLTDDQYMLALRLPAGSRAVGVLDDLVP
jgi:hypothetical protein